MWHDCTQQHLCSIYRKTAETARGPPLGMPPDRLQPHRCPLDPRTLLRRIRHSSSPGAPKSRPVDANDSLRLGASWRPRSNMPFGAAEYRLPASRVNTPSPPVCPAQRRSQVARSLRRVPPLPHLPRTSYLFSSDPYVISCVSLARSMTSRDKTRTATPRARSSKPITLSPDPSGPSDPRQGSLKSRRHPDRARWIPPFRAQGPLRAVALLRTLST